MSLRLRTWAVVVAGIVGLALALSMLGIGHNGGVLSAQAGPGGALEVGKLFVDGITPAGTPAYVNSWSLGASNPTSVGSGGMSSGKVNVQDISITKQVDKSSPLLFKALATGKHIKTVKLSLYDTGTGGDIDNPVITLTDVMVSRWRDDQDGPTAVETVSFSYAKIEYLYNKDGASSSVCYDLALQKKC
jgi:type VI secretion system secreted protein Hcp